MSNHQQQLLRTVMGDALSAAVLGFVADDAEKSEKWLLGGVVYQACEDCGRRFYPAQPICPNCLSSNIQMQHDNELGKLLSRTNLHVSFNSFYRVRCPWSVGLVKHPKGPRYYVFLDKDLTEPGAAVSLFTAPDVTSHAVILGVVADSNSERRAKSIAARLTTQ